MRLSGLEVMRSALTQPYQRGLEIMTLALGTTTADGSTPIQPYDFQRYALLYGEPPSAHPLPDSPRYLLVPLFTPTNSLELTFTFTYARNGQSRQSQSRLQLPAGSPPGLSMAIPLPPDVDPALASMPTLRLTSFRVLQEALPGAASANWTILALLGNLAKLLWVLSWEVDHVAIQLDDVQAQRFRRSAHSLSLDFLGRDLGVPRFPPTAYSWDGDTLALYHMDDVPPAGRDLERVEDAGKFQKKPGQDHPAIRAAGTPAVPQPGRPGRFKTALKFVARSAISIAAAPDLDAMGAMGASFTVEAFVRPDRQPLTGLPRGALIAKKATAMNDPSGPGWSLALGSFRAIPNNVRFSASDGTRYFEVFADRDLADGSYHHVACVLERRPGFSLIRLFIDSREAASTVAPDLDAVANGEAILIGLAKETVGGAPQDAQYLGLLDELRLSSVARASFHPVVGGEGDEPYRRRLGIFQRWFLPTGVAIARALNQLVQVNNQKESFVVDETVNDLVVGTRTVRVVPHELAPGQSITRTGEVGKSEAAVVGTAAQDTDFDEAWLVSVVLDGATVQMERSVREVLTRLRRDTALGTPPTVVKAYDPQGPGLHSVGRALALRHHTATLDRVAARAHAVGFDYVRREGQGNVYVAQAPRDQFEIKASPPNPIEGATVALSLDPVPPQDCQVVWSLAQCGAGAAAFDSPNPHVAGGDPKNQWGQVLHTSAAGDISVHVEVTRRRKTGHGNLDLRIRLLDTSLASDQSISANGSRTMSESEASPASPFFNETYLVMRDDPPAVVDFGSDLLRRQMQKRTSQALDSLLSLLPPQPARLAVEKAYDPAAGNTDPHKEGRALVISHSSLPPSALAAKAFEAGFDYIKVQGRKPGPGDEVHVSVAGRDLIAVSGPSQTPEPAQVEIDGSPLTLSVEPASRPRAVCFLPAGDRAYVADEGNHRLTEVQLNTVGSTFPSLLVTRSVGVALHPVSVCATTNRVYVANQGSDSVSVIDPSRGGDLQVLPSIATDQRPVAVAVRPDGSLLYVACQAGRTVKAYNTSNGTLAATFTVSAPSEPVALAPSLDGTRLNVLLSTPQGPGIHQGAFRVLDGGTLGLMGPNPVTTGNGPVSAVVAGRNLLIACLEGGALEVYDTTSNAPTASITLPPGLLPGRLAASADGRFVFVTGMPATSKSAGRVHIVDAAASPPVLLSHSIETVNPFAVATSPSAAPYPSAVMILSREDGNLALADPGPLLPGGASPPRLAQVVALGSGAGELLTWSQTSAGVGGASLDSSVKPTIQLSGQTPGLVSVRAIYLWSGKRDLYEFEVRLNDALERSPDPVTIRKDQYDIVMNLLNSLHPIGVEVRTEKLRRRVPELRDDISEFLPGYTFPVFKSPRLPGLNGIRRE